MGSSYRFSTTHPAATPLPSLQLGPIYMAIVSQRSRNPTIPYLGSAKNGASDLCFLLVVDEFSPNYMLVFITPILAATVCYFER